MTTRRIFVEVIGLSEVVKEHRRLPHLHGDDPLAGVSASNTKKEYRGGITTLLRRSGMITASNEEGHPPALDIGGLIPSIRSTYL